MFVYRSGTPEIAENRAFPSWGAVDDKAPNNHVLRRDALYAVTTPQEAEDWADWRDNMDLDTDVYEIEIPDDINVMAYQSTHFDNVSSSYGLDNEIEEMNESIELYWKSGISVLELQQKLLGQQLGYEVMVSPDVLAQAKIRKVNPFDFSAPRAALPHLGSVSTAQPAGGMCSLWMPVAKTTCALSINHSGSCRQ